MGLALPVHVVAAVLGLVFGYVALYAVKGAALHRRSGTLFVYAMVTMGLMGAALAIVHDKQPASNAPVGVLTAYLVITALTTVRPRSAASRRLDLGLMLVALTVGLTLFASGTVAAASPKGTLNGMPAAPFFVFGLFALLASAGDVRMIRSGGLQGAARLRRHLWRMCFALFLGAASFFLGPTRRIPEVMRVPALLPIPVLLVVATMLYWLWRVRSRRSVRGVAGLAPRSPASLTPSREAI